MDELETTSTTINTEEEREKIKLEERVEELKKDIERLENAKNDLCDNINSLYCKNIKYLSILRDTQTKYHRVFSFDCNFQTFWKDIEEGKYNNFICED